MKTLLFIVNPRAGRTKSPAPLFDAIARFSQVGYLVRLFLTTGAGDARQAAAECGNQYDLIVCAGGDGTLNETLNGLMLLDNPPPLGYLPCGSTNDFAASLHLSSNPSLAAAAIATGRGCPLDVGRHNDQYFAYVASFGAFTKASYSASQSAKNALGHLAYILEGLSDLDSLRAYCARIETDEEVFEGKFIFGAVCNSTSLGGLMKLNQAQVEMDDGKFELLLLKMPQSVAELQSLIHHLLHMRYDAPGIIFRHVSGLTMSSEENIPWSLDGEFAPGAPMIRIENIHRGVTLCK